MAAPVTKMEPSSAYSTGSPIPAAMVVMSPADETGASLPVCMRTNDPVP